MADNSDEGDPVQLKKLTGAVPETKIKVPAFVGKYKELLQAGELAPPVTPGHACVESGCLFTNPDDRQSRCLPFLHLLAVWYRKELEAEPKLTPTAFFATHHSRIAKPTFWVDAAKLTSDAYKEDKRHATFYVPSCTKEPPGCWIHGATALFLNGVTIRQLFLTLMPLGQVRDQEATDLEDRDECNTDRKLRILKAVETRLEMASRLESLGEDASYEEKIKGVEHHFSSELALTAEQLFRETEPDERTLGVQSVVFARAIDTMNGRMNLLLSDLNNYFNGEDQGFGKIAKKRRMAPKQPQATKKQPTWVDSLHHETLKRKDEEALEFDTDPYKDSKKMQTLRQFRDKYFMEVKDEMMKPKFSARQLPEVSALKVYSRVYSHF